MKGKNSSDNSKKTSTTNRTANMKKKTHTTVLSFLAEKQLEKKILSDLIDAIKLNNIVIVRQLIKNGIKNINAEDGWVYQATPLHWAAKHASKEIISLLIDAGARLASDFLLDTPIDWAKEAGRDDIAKFIETTLVSSSDLNTNNKLSELKIGNNAGLIAKKSAERDGRKISMYGFPDKIQAREEEVLWEKQVVTKFFKIGRPLKKAKQSYKIHQTIIKHINNTSNTPVNITGYARRSLIIALSKILTEHQGMPKLVFQLGDTIIKFIPSGENGTQRQIGNFKMEIPGIFDIAYGQGCNKRIQYLCQKPWDDAKNKLQRKAILLNHIEKSLEKLDPFTYRLFNKDGNIAINSQESASSFDGKATANMHFLNGLMFLITVVEVLVRLYRSKEGNIFPYSNQKAIKSDSFPVAIAQARSILLLLENKISFDDFLGQSQRLDYNSEQHRAFFGAVTGRATIDHIEMMFKKLFAINNEYNELISDREVWQEFKTDYLKNNKKGKIIEGKSRMYFDLKDVYGSGSESDEDTSDYSDSDHYTSTSGMKI